jgi:hypothetical protein
LKEQSSSVLHSPLRLKIFAALFMFGCLNAAAYSAAVKLYERQNDPVLDVFTTLSLILIMIQYVGVFRNTSWAVMFMAVLYGLVGSAGVTNSLLFITTIFFVDSWQGFGDGLLIAGVGCSVLWGAYCHWQWSIKLQEHPSTKESAFRVSLQEILWLVTAAVYFMAMTRLQYQGLVNSMPNDW